MKKNAKPSKVREQTDLERKDDLCEEKLALYLFFLMPRLFTDNYF